jgi:hypothetical protein
MFLKIKILMKNNLIKLINHLSHKLGILENKWVKKSFIYGGIPRDGKIYLVANPCYRFRVSTSDTAPAYYCEIDKKIKGMRGYDINYYTHWMPLPEPPEHYKKTHEKTNEAT